MQTCFLNKVVSLKETITQTCLALLKPSCKLKYTVLLKYAKPTHYSRNQTQLGGSF